MMTFLEKLSYLMEEENLNKRQFSIKTDIPYSTLSNLWKRGSNSLTLPVFRKICNYFDVTMDSMAHDDQDIQYRSELNSAPLARDERSLIDDYSKLDQRGKKTVLDAAKRELEYSIENKGGGSSDSQQAG